MPDLVGQVKAVIVDEGVEILFSVNGVPSHREMIEMKEQVKEKGIRQWLINNGWTPPEDSKDEI